MNTRAAAALLLMICVAPSADLAAQDPPSAPDWSATFSADAMKAHQRGAERHIVLPGDANAKEAAAALVAGLRAAGAPLVMDSAALGDTTGVEDQALLTKTSPLPVARVWIVRVYPGAQPGEQSAVLLVYENTGAKLRYAVQATPAKPLDPPPAATTSAASGVSAHALDAVIDKKKPAKKTQNITDNKQKYLDNELGITVLEIVEHNTSGVNTTTKTIPWRGQDKRTISWPEFYEFIGRSDLAVEYRSNESTKTALLVTGVGLITVGTGIALFSLLDDDQYFSELTLGGLGIVTIGAIFSGVYAAYDLRVVSDNENLRLARYHNEALQKALDLDKEDVSSFNIQIAPMFHTPGVVFHLTF